MTDNRGVFFLNEVQQDASTGDWVPLSTVYTQRPPAEVGSNAGYYGGGSFPPNNNVSNVDKISYADDTRSTLTTKMSAGSGNISTVQGSTSGYFVGGLGSPHGTITDRISYSTESLARVPGADLPQNRYSMGTTNSSDAGYFTSGIATPAPVAKQTLKMPFSSETFSALPSTGDLAAAWLYYGLGVGNLTNGYVAQGFAAPAQAVSSVSRMAYSTDTLTRIPGANATKSLYFTSGAGGGPAHTYFYGGQTAPGISPSLMVSDVVKFTFSTESCATVPGMMTSDTSKEAGGTGNSSNSYISGGSFNATDASTSSVVKFTYATDGRALAPSANGSVANVSSHGLSSRDFSIPAAPTTFPVQQFTTGLTPQPNIGYAMGLSIPAYTNKIDKFDMSTETASNPGNTLPTPNGYAGNVGSRTKSYIFGGTRSSSPYVFANSQVVTYASEVAASLPGANLTAARYGTKSTSSSDAAYTAGGRSPSTVSRMDKMTYSNETTAQVTNGSLSRVDYYMVSMGSQSAGYWGATADVSSNFDKLSYTTDTTSNQPNFSKQFCQRGDSSASTGTFAFMTGGPSGTSTIIERADFTTETVSYTPSANLVKSSNKYVSTFSNNDYGYFGGGSPAPSVVTSIDKITFATSTTSTLPSQFVTGGYGAQGSSPRSYGTSQAPLSTPTAQTANVPIPAGPNPSYDFGYTSGGPGYTGNYKLNFSDDTYARTPTNMPQSLYGSGAHSSSTHGYATGGRYSVTDYLSTTNKVSYADDTWSSGGDAVTGTHYCSASNSTTAGYVFGGARNSDPWSISTTQKYTYSSDSVAAVPGAATSISQRGGAFGNASVGYYTSLEPTSPRTKYKITYSDDTSAANPFISDALQTARPTAASSPSGGYLMAGNTGSTVVKTTFSTDTAARLPGADLPASGQSFTGGMGSTTAGYVCGGFNPAAPNIQSIIQKVNFSNDTSSALSGTMDKGEYWKIHLSSKTCHVAGTGSSPVNC